MMSKKKKEEREEIGTKIDYRLVSMVNDFTSTPSSTNEY